MKAACLIIAILVLVAVIGVCLMVKFATEISVEERRRDLKSLTNVYQYPRSIGVIPIKEPNNIDRFPYTAAVLGNRTNTWSLACFGSVILSKWIVTSAHCKKFNTIYNVLIYSDFVNNATQSIGTVLWKIHEKYNPKSYKFDIAVVKIDTEIINDEDVAALNVKQAKAVDVCLWRTVLSMNNEVYLTNEVNYYFQTTEESSICTNSFGVGMDSSLICLDFSKHPDCFMNEFGPIYLDDNVVGVLAGKPKDCDSKTALFTNVSFYFDWIMQVTHTTVV